MNRQATTVHIIGFITKQIEKLCVAHGNKEVKSRIGVTDDNKQGGFLIPEGIKLQFVIGGQLPKLLNIKGSEPCTTGNKDRLSGFSRDELSRTF